MIAQPIRVLMIEDSPTDALLVREALAETGRSRFELTHAERLTDAVTFLRSWRFDVILLDLGLPDSQGLETFRSLHETAPELPIVVLTGLLDEGAAMEALEAGAQDYLIKGEVTGAMLASAVRYAIHRGRAEEALRQSIMEQRKAEQELKRAKEAAESANAAKDQFIAALSHELRTPLTPVLMISQVLKSDPRLPEAVRTDMDAIHRNVALEVKLIDDLLDLTRITRGKIQLKPEIVDVHELLRHAIETCGGDILREKRIELTTTFAARHCQVWADAARLQQVFWNLLKNAIKFTPEGGRITVRTFTPEAGSVCIQIADSGVGIPSEKIARVFNAFEQGSIETTRRFGGLGLGLTICKSIVDLHNGRIEASSDGPGQGAAFTVELPPAMPREVSGGTTAELPGLKQDVPPGELPILLVEDHAPTATVLERLLKSWGWNVRTASTLRTAIELAGEQQFALVLSDLGLPDGTGHDLMQRLNNAYGLTGIALSGYGTDEDINRSLESGFVQHLVKPVDFEHLKKAIMDLIAGKKRSSDSMVLSDKTR